MKIEFDRIPAHIGRTAILDTFNKLEEQIGELIYYYFLPQRNPKVFKEIVLSGVIMDVGAKMKILNNIDEFDKKIIDKLRELNSIRNGVVHNNPEELKGNTMNYRFSMINSSGKLVKKDFKVQLNRFTELHQSVENYILEFQRKSGKA